MASGIVRATLYFFCMCSDCTDFGEGVATSLGALSTCHFFLSVIRWTGNGTYIKISIGLTLYTLLGNSFKEAETMY